MRRRDRPPDLVLFDGVCGLCDRLVRWLVSIDREGRLRFAPLQGATAAPILARHPAIADVDSLVWVRGAGTASEAVAARSASVVAALRALGGVWRLVAGFLWVIPRPIRDRLYDAFARRRYRWFGRLDSCRLPTTAEADRFLP